MSSSIREWLNLSVRWIHVFAGIMWVGQNLLLHLARQPIHETRKKGRFERGRFQSLDGAQRRFYSVEKQKSLAVAPEQVRWFRWEALMTWVAGVILLVLVYYLGDGLIDPDVADISKQAGIAIGVVRSWQAGLSTICGAVTVGKIAGCVRGIWFGHDCGGSLGIDACVERPRCLHPRGSDLRHHHDVERVDAHSSSAAQDDYGGSSGEKLMRRSARKRSCVRSTIHFWPCRSSF